jgi:hypothetical protein
VHGARRSGQGAFVDVSTFEAMTIAFNQFQAVAAQLDGRGPEPEAIGRFVDVPSVEPTADGWVGFATNASAQFRAFAEMVGHPEWADDPELGRVDRRGEHDRTLRAERPPDRYYPTVEVLHRERGHPGRAAKRRDAAGVRFVERGVPVEHPTGAWCSPGSRLSGVDRARWQRRRRRRCASKSAARAMRTTSRRRARRSPACGCSTSRRTGRSRGADPRLPGADVVKVESVQRRRRDGTAYSSGG